MRKLVKGILDFKKTITPSYRETFARLALGQSPDTLFIACSDSRVAPNVFASTDPGDMFVIRNVGNLVPPCAGDHGHSVADESEAAAIEFAINQLGVSDIVVCGHAECGAMHALLQGRKNIQMPNLKSWLRHGENALVALDRMESFAATQPAHNRLSQLNVLQQIENLKSYPVIRNRLEAGTLRLHGWWFEVGQATVHAFDPDRGGFFEIDEAHAAKIVAPIEAAAHAKVRAEAPL